MRLGEIYSICNKFNSDIDGEWVNVEKYLNEPIPYDGEKEATKKVIKKLNYISKLAHKRLVNVECLQKSLLYMDDIFSDERASISAKSNAVRYLLNKIECIIELCESVGVSNNSLGLDIKMPPTNDITDFRKYVDDLEFIFTKCPFFQSNEESLKLQSVDCGSVWLVISVAGVAGTAAFVASRGKILNNIAAFIDKCIIIKSHRLTTKWQERELEKAEMNQQDKEEILKFTKKIFSICVDNAIKDLSEATGIEIKDGDEKGRVEQSFERLERLMDKGLQIYSSIDSPDEVKAVFEPIEKRYLSQKDVLEQIEEKLDELGEQKENESK